MSETEIVESLTVQIKQFETQIDEMKKKIRIYKGVILSLTVDKGRVLGSQQHHNKKSGFLRILKLLKTEGEATITVLADKSGKIYPNASYGTRYSRITAIIGQEIARGSSSLVERISRGVYRYRIENTEQDAKLETALNGKDKTE